LCLDSAIILYLISFNLWSPTVRQTTDMRNLASCNEGEQIIHHSCASRRYLVVQCLQQTFLHNDIITQQAVRSLVCCLNDSEALEDATRLYRQVRACYDRLLRLGDSRLTVLRHYVRVRELDDSVNQVGVHSELELLELPEFCRSYVCLQRFVLFVELLLHPSVVIRGRNDRACCSSSRNEM
jgi:hypothetical protein